MFSAILTAGVVYGAFWFPRQGVRIGAFLFSLELWKTKQANTEYEQFFKTKYGVDIGRVIKRMRKRGSEIKDEDLEGTEERVFFFTIEDTAEPRLKFFVGKRFALTEEEMFLFQKGIEAIRADEAVPVDFVWLETISQSRVEEMEENEK